MSPEQLFAINVALLVAVVIATLWTVVTARIVYAAVGLALTSACIAVFMFMMSSPIAGVFELSVCAGLIPAIFLSAISVARRMSATAEVETARDQMKRFWPLPIIIVLVGIVLIRVAAPALPRLPVQREQDVRVVLWTLRHMDIIGQIVILLAGAFAVVVLLKEPRHG
jgi:NADH:ubiquinone oxidoreductase subunit 6 (subunit J)